MDSLSALLLSGLAFGLSAGLTPGPLLTLTISQTLRFGPGEGVKVALAPIITDLPIILAALFILSRLARVEPLLGAISVAGAAFLLYLGWESITFKGVEYTEAKVKPHSLRKGIIANFLNPSPYMFWFIIGGPILFKAKKLGVPGPLVFIVALYCLLVGSKMTVAVLAGRSRSFLKSRNYIYTLKVLGLVLWGFAVIYFRDGLKYWGVF